MTAAVLFDVDGTLVDTPSGMTGVLRAVVAEAGRTVSDRTLQQTIGRPLAASFSELFALPADHRDVVRATERARTLFTETVVPLAANLVFPGAREVLRDLREREYRLAVVTSKIRSSADELLSAAGLRHMFDTLSCHGMTAHGKPHPSLALLASEAVGVPPERCVVVGDGVDDMRMAVAAGMEPVGVATGVASRAELLAVGGQVVLDHLGDLLTRLPANGGAGPVTHSRILTSTQR
ncbi:MULTISPECIES: HAD family hydrolase [unclassified Micromonospora]|uniref:HAD family hydrolase n=1 Tax=unclassified Micromonospora TaxID=2617518 RepID=UPI003A8715C5